MVGSSADVSVQRRNTILARLLVSSKGLAALSAMSSRMPDRRSIGRELEIIALFISAAYASAIVMEVIILLVEEYARHACVLAVMS